MARFLVIGAAALDRPIWLSNAATPGARVRGRSLGSELGGRLGGGGANAAVALRKSGHEVWLAAAPSAEPDGAEVLDRAIAAGLDTRLSLLRAGRGGTTLILIGPDGDRTVMGLDNAAGEVRSIRTLPADQAPGFDGLFIRAAYAGAGEWAERVRGPVLLHHPSSPYDGPADVIVASADDLTTTALSDPFGESLARLAPDHAPRLAWVVVTHGADGAVAHGRTDRLEAPAVAAQVRDATGAGDIFAAGLLEALVAGAGMEHALRHACAWGAIAVGLDCSAPVDLMDGGFPSLRM
jgi:sugar/nucleoside kinase (ribokinase family)